MSSSLSFSIRVSSGIKTVDLLGSWDGYNNQLPLSKDKSSSSKSGTWKGTFKFHNLEAGERYWYYFVIDGYHYAANPSIPLTVEPTTGRELNILDMPLESSSSKSSSSKHSSSSSKHSSSKHSSSSSASKHSSSKHSSSKHSSSKHSSSSKSSSRGRASDLSVDIPKGRPLSASEIKSPKPMTPRATARILKYGEQEVDELTSQFASAGLETEDIVTNFDMRASPASSSAESAYSRSDSSSPSSSGSGYSTPGSDYSACTCERYGITRRGDRVKMDCGGAVCGYDEGSECSSGSEEETEAVPIRRRGVMVQ